MGNFGNGIGAGITMFWMVYFFFPPADAGIPYMIPQESIFMGLTVIGLILGINRLIDAVTDAWIANMCDKSKNPKGKYIPMMRLAAPGIMIFMVSVYYVPDPGEITAMNVIWVSITIALSSLATTMYYIPYYALQVKIAPHVDDKLDLNTIMGAFWFVGLVLASFSGVFWDFYASIWDITKVESMQLTFISLAVLGILTLLIPPFFIRESDYEDITAEEAKRPRFVETAKVLMRDKIFMHFLFIITLYYLATYMFETGLVYFITVLALMEAGAQGPLTIAIGVITFISYPFVNRFAKNKGKKQMMKVGFVLFTLMFISISLLGMWGIPIWLMMGLVILFAPIPQSIFQMLPGAMTADCAAWNEYETGEDVAAMYVAVGGFITKLGGSLAMILFTSLLLFGKDVGDDLGIRLAVIVGAVLCVVGFFILLRYNEEKMMSYSQEGE